MVGVKGLKPSTSRSQTARAINCATPRWCYLMDYNAILTEFPVFYDEVCLCRRQIRAKIDLKYAK